jgi:hypothetical protein
MSTNKEKPPALDDILQDIASDTMKPTALGKKAMAKAAKRRLFYAPKSQNDNAHKQSIARLESLKEEISKPRHRKKGKDVLERTPKEIVESAMVDLCAIYFQTTGYDARWLRDSIEEHWLAGRSPKHSEEKRIICCQFIHFLKSQKISDRQAMALANQVYDFNKTDAKDSYYFFRRDIQKYYFPEIKLKSHIQIRAILDALQYGSIKILRVPPLTNEAVDKFEEIVNAAIELLREEIQFAKKQKLNKIGVEINPLISNYLNRFPNNGLDLIEETQKSAKIKRDFAIYAKRFLNDLEFYREIE